MPVYEYGCSACGSKFEVTAKIADPPPPQCLHCKSGPIKRLISQTSFVLKGSGWYTTDYKSSKQRGAPATESDSTKEQKAPAAPASSATDSKPSDQAAGCASGSCKGPTANGT
jgi:putative FmdB family regulatory protein